MRVVYSVMGTVTSSRSRGTESALGAPWLARGTDGCQGPP